MTVSTGTDARKPGSEPVKQELVTLTIDGIETSVPKGTLVIRAAEQIGVQIPRFCDHPLLAPAGACRQCLVEVPDAGNGRGFPKPQASCTLPVAEGMVVSTQTETWKREWETEDKTDAITQVDGNIAVPFAAALLLFRFRDVLLDALCHPAVWPMHDHVLRMALLELVPFLVAEHVVVEIIERREIT